MGWKWHKGKKLDYLTIPEWTEKGVILGFSSRKGGISKEPYSSLNLGLHVGDDSSAVLENRKIFLNEFNCNFQDCTAGKQVHGTNVVFVTEEAKGRGMYDPETAFPDTDGLLTEEYIALMAFFADCVPLYFFNPRLGLIGLAHAGWKGTANRIAAIMLKKMEEKGGRAADCLVAVGPSIGKCCYEVGEEVFRIFRENFNEVSDFVVELPDRKYKLDLKEANKKILLSEGVLPENIQVSSLCTACHPDRFYSYRRDGLTGRMAAFIWKKGERSFTCGFNSHSR